MTLKSIDLLIYILCPRKLEELVQILEEAEKKDPKVKISIIVVFEHNSFLNERMLREGGLDIETIFPFIDAAAGTIAAYHIRQFAERPRPGVNIIEPDRKYALG